jgi:hypothetical protein
MDERTLEHLASGEADRLDTVETMLLRRAPAACDYCEPDHKFYGPGWVYMGNNGPISPCPICNPNGATRRQQ